MRPTVASSLKNREKGEAEKEKGFGRPQYLNKGSTKQEAGKLGGSLKQTKKVIEDLRKGPTGPDRRCSWKIQIGKPEPEPSPPPRTLDAARSHLPASSHQN